jgi:uncharacterized membrane protein
MRWENTVLIEAPADRVWQLTIDVTNWPSLTPTMQRVERLDDGPIRVGSSARIKQPGQTPAVWTVTRIDAGHEFTWQTRRMGMTMTGSHIVEDAGDRCRNTLTIDITGPTSGLFGIVFGGVIRKSLDTENAGFKSKAQQPA